MKISNFLKNYFSNLKIRNKLMISYFPMIIIIIGIGAFSYKISSNILTVESVKVVKQAEQQSNRSVNKSITSYEDFIKNIFYTSNMQKFLKNDYSGNDFSSYKNIDDFRKILETWLTVFNNPVNLAIVRNEGSAQEIILNNCHNILQINENKNVLNIGGDGNYQIYNVDRLKSHSWFQNLKIGLGDMLWMQVDDDKKYNNISIIKAIPDFGTFDKSIGYIILTVRLKDIFDDKKINEGSSEYYNMAFDNQGNIIYLNNYNMEFYNKNKVILQRYLKATKPKDTININNTVVLKDTIKTNGWQILNFIPMNGVKKQTRYIGAMVILSCGIAILIVLLVSYGLSELFSKRIKKICTYMQKFQEGNFNKKLTTIHNDELGYLALSFNEMVEKTQVLVQEVYVANIDKKEARLKALQAQINPHFLYNSLSSISRLANKGEVNKINIMVASLVKFYRLTLNKGKDIIQVSDEIEQIKAYVEVLKIRMAEAFNIQYKIDEEVLKYYTVSVILQPFVENALEHGIYDREDPINIIFSAKVVDEKIIFKIQDDGIGFSEEIQEKIFKSGENSKGYGIRNVDARIKLQFGNDYGVSISSKAGLGTSIMISIPKYEL